MKANDNRTLPGPTALPEARFSDLINERLTAIRSIIAQITLTTAREAVIARLRPPLRLPGMLYE
ncbi:hypothetical protein FOT81_23190 [Raoultella planticola]|nr:hypothetical protein MC50_007330 [Raoultella planticola]MBE0094087.1 hypothetical protein [Raoultella planticola]PNK78702.1 hypothetical protein CEP62_011790 [Raoultella planticola]QEU43405.1 hypothetical protein F3X94_19705 [Raoultella planticola]TQN58443.1 hypothetical protein FLW98_01155 [Raoultella planticola]